jgi:nitrogen fixation NifU-like protein
MNFGDDLYREIILENYKSKKNKRPLDNADRREEGVNPSCGDDIELYMNVEDGVITEVTYDGVGCSICLASANMLCEALRGMTLEDALEIVGRFKGMLVDGQEVDFSDTLEDLEAMQGVRKFPVRIKCALLSWNTAEQLLKQ